MLHLKSISTINQTDQSSIRYKGKSIYISTHKKMKHLINKNVHIQTNLQKTKTIVVQILMELQNSCTKK